MDPKWANGGRGGSGGSTWDSAIRGTASYARSAPPRRGRGARRVVGGRPFSPAGSRRGRPQQSPRHAHGHSTEHDPTSAGIRITACDGLTDDATERGDEWQLGGGTPDASRTRRTGGYAVA